jgi:hypothetical protein
LSVIDGIGVHRPLTQLFVLFDRVVLRHVIPPLFGPS